MSDQEKSKTYDESDASETLYSARPMPDSPIGRFPERLKSIMGGLGARAFSRTCGLSEGAIRSYLSSDTYPTLDRLAQIADATGVSVLWLGFGHIEGANGGMNLDTDIFALIPLYDARCSAGYGAWNEGAKELTKIAFTHYSLRKKGLKEGSLSAIQVDGDSMEGLLDDGDTVLIDHSRNTMEGEAIYVVRLDDHLYAKRLQREWDGSIRIISANSAYDAMVVPKERLGELEIVGRVVWAGGWLV